MKKGNNFGQEIFIKPRSLVPFLLGIFAINFIYDGVVALLLIIFPITNYWGIKIGIGVLLLILAAFKLRQEKAYIAKPSHLLLESVVSHRKGLIILASIGRGISSAINAIDYHLNSIDADDHLKFVEILAGPGDGANSSKEQAEQIKNKYEELGVSVHIINLKDSEDPSQTFLKTNQAIDNLIQVHKLNKNDIIADYTGGTKSMSTGLFMACYSRNCDIQFMKPTKLTDEGRADFSEPSRPRLVEVNFGKTTNTSNKAI